MAQADGLVRPAMETNPSRSRALLFYNSITGMRRKPLQAPPPYLFYVALLLVMLLSDAAAYRVYKALGGLR